MNALVVARKELLDHVRDGRALASTALYTLMGPIIVWLVFSMSPERGDGSGAVRMAVMAAVFTLVAAFSGGMSVAMDMIAGERERRSLLPLLMNSASRFEIVVGKWLAASVFASGGCLFALLAFVLVFGVTPAASVPGASVLLVIPGLIALALLAAALEILVSSACRSLKEANTYLSILIFVVIGVGMWLAFDPRPGLGWSLAPVVGQQRALQIALANGNLPLWELAGAGVASVVAALLLVIGAGQLFQRDAIIYGN